jgi:response regulator RpfG family c-di-GMP phosphodiesterase
MESQFQDHKPDDLLIFADEDGSERKPLSKGVWKVVIADDEEEVHTVTRMALGDICYKGKGILFLNAYSGKEVVELMRQNPDTALILLDVVMEEDDTGLKVIRKIREELKNEFVRIVIRTGQPGEAPEKNVIVDYDINDYKEKSELTSQKLFTMLVSSLRSYENLSTIDNTRKGLEKIIQASESLFKQQSLDMFVSEVLEQFRLTLIKEKSSVHGFSAFFATKTDGTYVVSSAIGRFDKNSLIDRRIMQEITGFLNGNKENNAFKYLSENRYLSAYRSVLGFDSFLYMERGEDFNQSDKYLIEILSSYISMLYENLYLNREIEETQKEIIYRLGEVVETRSNETGYHVKRVAEYSKLLALKYGLSEEEAELIKQASPLHDIGKVGIFDSVLNKDSKLTEQEFELMKTHSAIGYNILKTSSRRILKAAAIIALQHHERYNGKGYPCGLKGEEIHIYGRITCIADVFDALGSDRTYKKAWELDKILKYFREERGELFDPRLLDIFFDNLKEILAIRDSFTDLAE